MMKVYLDDVRPAPEGWTLATTAQQAIDLLQQHQVTHISLDHDLGPPEAGTGYDVILWLEKALFDEGRPLPIVLLHTANPVARARMLLGLERCRRGVTQWVE